MQLSQPATPASVISRVRSPALHSVINLTIDDPSNRGGRGGRHYPRARLAPPSASRDSANRRRSRIASAIGPPQLPDRRDVALPVSPSSGGVVCRPSYAPARVVEWEMGRERPRPSIAKAVQGPPAGSLTPQCRCQLPDRFGCAIPAEMRCTIDIAFAA